MNTALIWLLTATILKWTGFFLGLLAIAGIANLLWALRTAGDEIDQEIDEDAP